MSHDWRNHPKYGLMLEFIELGIKRGWCRETASPSVQSEWSPENPSLGQCAVTTALLHDYLKHEFEIDAEILRGEVTETIGGPVNFGSHYWIRLPDGTEVDMTLTQFPEGTIIPKGELRTLDYLLDSDRAKTARTRERMDLLSEKLDEIFEVLFAIG